MHLSVPNRTVADTGSFPVNPEGVARWLAQLNPQEDLADAHEIYRGLKHSNRLHNELAQRRSVISCFIPVLRELHEHLSELTVAQPLPLTREYAQCARLRDSLLREEAFAFKVLLCDSVVPLADDARRAMHALARQAECVVQAYRNIPDALIEDAHQLYTLAEAHDLLFEPDESLTSLNDYYQYILLLSISELTQQRLRQLPVILDFLRNCATDVHIEQHHPTDAIGRTDFAVDLRLGSRPEPALSLLSPQQSDVRWFSIAPILLKVYEESPHSKARTSSAMGGVMLERQSLTRLHMALARTRKRRLGRCITWQSRCVVFGHKNIGAHLLYRSAEDSAEQDAGWSVTNQSAQGACLFNSDCEPGLVQVGELVCISRPDNASIASNNEQNSKVDATLGVIRWIRANDDQGISVGVEFLARSALPVRITKSQHESQTNTQSPNIDIGEPALIIACKVQNKVLQTMLLPAYLYQAGDRLIARQGARSRKVELQECLQSNGLYTQFSLIDSQR